MKSSIKLNLMNDYHLLSYESVDSTNEEAKRLAAGGGSHGAVLWAKRQTNGRGRMERTWDSPPGNLYASVLLSPGCDMATAAQLSFVAAVAAVETLEPILPDHEVRCKWPNDIMVGERKVGGILTEYFRTEGESSAEGKDREWVVVGIGINVESFPKKGVATPATSLKEEGVEIVSAKIVLSRFVYNFICQYDIWGKKGFVPIRKAWLGKAYKLGEEIEVKVGTDRKTGTFKGMDTDGRLELSHGKGKKEYVNAGDVFFK